MLTGMNRRSFLQMSAAAGAVALTPRWVRAQAPAVPAMVVQARTAAATTAVKTTQLYDNLYLLQGAGGNIALQTGPEGNILIDSSYSTAAPRILEAVAAVSKHPADALINTHWHFDHTDGNEALHAAGYTIFAHQKTRERLSTTQNIKAFNMILPPAPVGGLPVITFEQSMHAWHNGDSLDLVYFEPAHTDSDIYIHFHKADVMHLGDIFFNGFYPFIDESTGGSIGGMIQGAEKALAVASGTTKIIPGHGPLGSKADLHKYRDMLATARDKVAALKAAGLSEQDAIAKKPTADLDPVWGKGMFGPDAFAGIIYRTL
jgi:glyoxylase-like metal-dependent hydrolase (beta-lactamase superfamily II)